MTVLPQPRMSPDVGREPSPGGRRPTTYDGGGGGTLSCRRLAACAADEGRDGGAPASFTMTTGRRGAASLVAGVAPRTFVLFVATMNGSGASLGAGIDKTARGPKALQVHAIKFDPVPNYISDNKWCEQWALSCSPEKRRSLTNG